MNGWGKSRILTKVGNSIFVPVVTFLILAGMILAVWWIALREESQDIRHDTAITAEQAALRIETFIETRLSAVNRIKEDWLNGKIHNQAIFETEAERAHRQFPGFEAITKIDADGVIRWAFPKEKYLTIVGRNVRDRPVPRTVFDKAKKSGEPQTTSPIDLIGGDKGIVVHFPLKPANRFDGSIGAVFRISNLIEEALRKGVRKNYFFTVKDGESQVYTHGSVPAEHAYSASHKITVLGREWAVALFPTKGGKED